MYNTLFVMSVLNIYSHDLKEQSKHVSFSSITLPTIRLYMILPFELLLISRTGRFVYNDLLIRLN